MIDDTLSPALRQRGQLLLSGRIRPADAEAGALAYAVRHIAGHPNLEADAFRRSREDVALAEIRLGLGDWARIRFGEAALRALVASAGDHGCLRCRADLIARALGLHRPGWDRYAVALLGEGCERCERRRSSPPRRPHAATPGDGARPTPVRPPEDLAAMIAAIPPGAPGALRLAYERWLR